MAADPKDQCAHCQAELDFFMAINECHRCHRHFCRACKSRPDVYIPANPDFADEQDVCSQCFNSAVCVNTQCHALIDMSADGAFRMCNLCQSPYCGTCVAAGHIQLAGAGQGGWGYPTRWCATCFMNTQTDRAARNEPLLEITTVDFQTSMINSLGQPVAAAAVAVAAQPIDMD